VPEPPPDPGRLTVQGVASDPACATFAVEPPRNATLEPLSSSHEGALAAFLEGLSPRSRRFFSVKDPSSSARERCGAIGRYDKLRLVLRSGPEGTVVALVEFSFDLPAGDLARYGRHGLELRPGTDCRWGLCVADEWQGRGVGAALARPSLAIARAFGRDRVLLWGGVHVANAAAVRYYGRLGFAEVGRFEADDGTPCIDMLLPLEAGAHVSLAPREAP
jgi:ribosomal protein S18 acetylase RimI-like enzyme